MTWPADDKYANDLARKLRVAIIEPVGGHGGMHYYDFELCRGLVAAGAIPVLHTCDATVVPSGLPFSVARRFRKVFGKDPAPLRGLRFLRGLLGSIWSACRSGTPVVHFHFFGAGVLQFFGVLAARLAGRRVVVTAHDVESFEARSEPAWLVKATYSLVHRVIAHNRASRDELVRKLGLSPKRIDVVPHGNYISFVSDVDNRAGARQRLGIALEAQVVLFFGQIKKVKGLDVLLHAMPRVCDVLPQVMLVVAGRPWRDDGESYRNLAERLGVANRCTMQFRYVPDDEVSYLFLAADLVVLPYRKIYQSGVALMAMSFCRAVLASDLPAMKELIRNQDNGFLFTSGGSEALAEAIVRVFRSAGQLRAVARRGYNTASVEHSWERVGELTVCTYLRALDRVLPLASARLR